MNPGIEQGLIERARAGSLEAFDRIMRHYQDRLYRFLLMRGLAPADAEDAVQDTFLAAWRYLGSYRPRWRFSTWLYTIACRKAAAKPPPDFGTEPAPVPGPDESACVAEQRENLWSSARKLLSGEQFSALWLYYGEDMETEEIGRILGRSVSWVKVNLHRGRQRLNSHLERVKKECINEPG